jgi:hypothetical protein
VRRVSFISPPVLGLTFAPGRRIHRLPQRLDYTLIPAPLGGLILC